MNDLRATIPAAVLVLAGLVMFQARVAPANQAISNLSRPIPASTDVPAERATTVRLVFPREASDAKGPHLNPLIQGIILLILTAVITGLAVPLIKSRMDMRYFRDQKSHEADLARQAKLINEQTAFLRAYADSLWQLHFAMLKVSYAKVTATTDDEFAALWNMYEQEAWVALQGQRRLISSAVNLVSPACFDQLLRFYEQIRCDEAELSGMVHESRPEDVWGEYHGQLLDSGAAKLDHEIIELAKEMNLTISLSNPAPADGDAPVTA